MPALAQPASLPSEQGDQTPLPFGAARPEGRARSMGWLRLGQEAQGGLSVTRLFALAGGTVFLAGMLIMAFVHMRMSVEQMTRMAEENNTALAIALSNALHDPLQRAERDHNRVMAHIDPVVRRTLYGTRVVKAKIYEPGGLTIYSSDPAQIGEDKSGNAGFQQALAGGTASILTFREQFDAFEGRIAERDLLSSYIPMRVGAEEKGVSYVFEIYTDVTEFKAQIHKSLAVKLAITAIAFLLIYAAALRIVAVGARELKRRHDEALTLTAAISRAEASNEAKSALIKQMSHELRTPLNTIIGFAELIRADGDNASGDRTGHAHEIHASASRLLDLVNAVLEFLDVEARRILVTPERVDCGALARNAVRAAAAAASERGVELRLEAAPDLDPVRTDERMVRRILANLLSNAIKFTPPGGTVAVSTAPGEDGRSIVIGVADTGIGIAADRLDACLAPFVQADSVLTRTSEGMGLGLALAKRYSDALGAQLTIASTVGQGTLVSLVLPES